MPRSCLPAIAPPSVSRVTACDLVLEYTLSAAAVAKGFTAYTAALIGVPVHYLRLEVGQGAARGGNAPRGLARGGARNRAGSTLTRCAVPGLLRGFHAGAEGWGGRRTPGDLVKPRWLARVG